jgi:hypothetical protein
MQPQLRTTLKVVHRQLLQQRLQAHDQVAVDPVQQVQAGVLARHFLLVAAAPSLQALAPFQSTTTLLIPLQLQVIQLKVGHLPRGRHRGSRGLEQQAAGLAAPLMPVVVVFVAVLLALGKRGIPRVLT